MSMSMMTMMMMLNGTRASALVPHKRIEPVADCLKKLAWIHIPKMPKVSLNFISNFLNPCIMHLDKIFLSHA